MCDILVDLSIFFDYRPKMLKASSRGGHLCIDPHFPISLGVMKLHLMYSVLVLLNLKPLDSRMCVQTSPYYVISFTNITFFLASFLSFYLYLQLFPLNL
uniref:Putative ovule protein n=1 Tax=Solanum chacoense TaxID=4108 RepID=A0A0V0I0D7_SOLCH